MAVADVPVGGLDLRGREGEGATLGKRLTVGGGSCLLLIVAGGIVCHDSGKVDLGVGHVSFADEISLQGRWVRSGGLVDSSIIVLGALIQHSLLPDFDPIIHTALL